MLHKIFLTSFALILLSSCGKTPEPTVITQTEYVRQNIPIQPRPAQVELVDVKWYVVTSDNIDEFLEQFEKDNGSVAFMAISVRGYENLSLNVQDLRRYILQQQQIIIYYENAAQEPTPPAQ